MSLSRNVQIVTGGVIGLLVALVLLFLPRGVHASPSPSSFSLSEFSVLTKPVPPATGNAGSGGLGAVPASAIATLRSLHAGSYSDARSIGDGFYISSNGGAVCMLMTNGLGACTDHLNAPGAWIAGDEIRQFDSELAPFRVHLYGLAVDGVSAVSLTQTDGSKTTIPVTRNGFDTTFVANGGFADIHGLALVKNDGTTAQLDPATYFPQH